MGNWLIKNCQTQEVGRGERGGEEERGRGERGGRGIGAYTKA